MKQLSQIYLLLLLVTGLSGCTTIGYYTQAIGGHLSLMTSGEPVDALLSGDHTDPELRSALQTAKQARLYAQEKLSLPIGDAFTEYVQLNHPWVVVNLVAVPEFSLEPHRWCYPVLGCQAYRGYFDIDDARAEQAIFEAEGYDTLIGGVTAYSTLGWFDDPLHSGFTRLSEDRMVALMFHELAHRVVYVDGDTAFNESFATAVELEGLKGWLVQAGKPQLFELALERLQQRQQTLELVREAANSLKTLYRQQGARPEEELRRVKADILSDLLASYNELTEHWAQPGPFGAYPEQLNNANLALFQQYNQYVPGFRELLRELDHNYPAFYNAVKGLAKQPASTRSATLEKLSERFTEDL
ncbi:putative zinc protease protein [Marinobacter nitratireducens]|uniref:Putative zinc protease protein n=1 Tax=Marinobacter nitratireducens TaxID=1137280 RepID=A0A072N0Q8_9GAMM|nr:aminopeptidase [Marinobacter nitratireducens]KEF30807.1 putative zinc protease protein [Marinobacter nitratireducens]